MLVGTIHKEPVQGFINVFGWGATELFRLLIEPVLGPELVGHGETQFELFVGAQDCESLFY